MKKISKTYAADNSVVNFTINSNKKQLKLAPLPSEFIDWQIKERLKLFQLLKEGKKPKFLSSHLPTIITFNQNKEDFPINAACKGIGLVPVYSEIEKIVTKIKLALPKILGSDFQSSLQQRIDCAMLFFNNRTSIDVYRLGGLEIFETKSYENIVQNPRVSLFFVGDSPTYKSYQLNCIAEIIEKDNPFYDFIKTMRALFEEAQFHYQQPAYPHAVRYNIVEVIEKTLKIRK